MKQLLLSCLTCLLLPTLGMAGEADSTYTPHTGMEKEEVKIEKKVDENVEVKVEAKADEKKKSFLCRDIQRALLLYLTMKRDFCFQGTISATVCGYCLIQVHRWRNM